MLRLPPVVSVPGGFFLQWPRLNQGDAYKANGQWGSKEPEILPQPLPSPKLLWAKAFVVERLAVRGQLRLPADGSHDRLLVG